MPRCKKCKCKVNKEDLLIKWIYYFCTNNCYTDYISYQKQTKNPPKLNKAIKKISSNNKNTIAKFTTETKAQILIRDKNCILCSKWISDYHHCYYWWQAEHWEDRNNVNKWVWLCANCHFQIHHWTDWYSQEYRKYCIDYVNWDLKKIVF